VGWLYWRGFDFATALMIGKPFNALRARLGLPPVRRLFRWWMSPDRVLAMFPEWYGEPQPDWLPQIRVTGFPMFDGAPGASTAAGLPADLESFLDAPGGPPVAFTFGTGVRDVPALFRAAADACAALGVRAIFLTKYAGQLPDPLPPHARHVPFAPFRQLFLRCAAVVHHGGVGTVAKALAAGVPQLVLPLAFDQKDNAVRVRRLGAGDWIPARRANAARVARALRDLLTPAARERSGAVAAGFGKTDALEVAAGVVEELGSA
jgi:UDP:flavonoid glycosyltransferase YjiC (YdhE family)